MVRGLKVVTIGEKYTIVIPKEIRTRLRLKIGQKLLIRVHDSSIVLEPLPEEPFKELERILGDFTFDRRARKRAEEFLMRVVREQCRSSTQSSFSR